MSPAPLFMWMVAGSLNNVKKFILGSILIVVVVAGYLAFKFFFISEDTAPGQHTTVLCNTERNVCEQFTPASNSGLLKITILTRTGMPAKDLEVDLGTKPGATEFYMKYTDKNGIAEAKKTLLSGLNKPHGLAFYGSGNTTYLYVAETQQVARYTYDVKSGTVISIKGENVTNLPSAGRHFTRTISFGPNFRETPLLTGKKGDTTLSQTKLYISVGSSCDVCVETTTWKRAAILESDPDGKIFTAEFAGGLRNSVFFTFHPKTKEIWATEMGRDNLGDNLPPDEINILEKGKNYGWNTRQIRRQTKDAQRFALKVHSYQQQLREHYK